MRNRYLIVLFLWIIAMPQALIAQKKGSAEYEAKLAATMVAIDSILASHGLNEPLEAFCDKLIEQYKNDPRLAFHVAEQFSRSKLQQHDIAYRRMEQLIKKYPKYMDGYLTYAELLVGRSERQNFDDSLVTVTRAKQIIDTCKVVLPDSIEPYMKWIRMFIKKDKQEVDKEAEALHARFPNYPVYRDVALEYTWAAKGAYINLMNRALEYFSKADRSSFSAALLTFNSSIYYMLGKYEEALEVAQYGIEKFPESKDVLRYVLWSNAELGQKEEENKNADIAKLYYTEAANCIEKFINHSDTLKLQYKDYMYSGIALQYIKRYDQAITMYRKEIEASDFRERMRQVTVNNICDCFTALGYPDSSLIEYENFLDYKIKKGHQMEASDFYELANKHQKYAKELMGLEKIAALKKTDSLYLCTTTIDSTINVVSLIYDKHLDLALEIEKLEFGDRVYEEAVMNACRLQIDYLTPHIEELTSSEKVRLFYAYYYISLGYFENTAKIDYGKAWLLSLGYIEKILILKPEKQENAINYLFNKIVNQIATHGTGLTQKKAKEIKRKYSY